MSLWRTHPNIEQLNAIQKNTIGEVLDIRFEAFDDESLTASMVIDHRTHQPYGLLHGGASVVLAETVGSMPVTCASTPASFTAWAWKSTPTICAACAVDGSRRWPSRFTLAARRMSGISV